MREDRFRVGPTSLLSSLFLAVTFLPVAFVLFTVQPAAAMPPLRLGARVGYGSVDRNEAVNVGVDAGAFVLPRLSVDLRVDYAERSTIDLSRPYRIYTDVGVTFHDSSRTAFVSAFGGLAFRQQEEIWDDANVKNRVAPEVGMSFGRLVPLGAGVGVGPSITLAFGEVEKYGDSHVGATRLGLALGGTFDVGIPEDEPELKEPLGVSAGARVFVVGGPGIGAEIGYALLPHLELGTQWLRRLDISGEYCNRCVLEDDRFAAYVEGRIPGLGLVAPYARLSLGAGKLRLTGDDSSGYWRDPVDGTFANLGGELGLEAHGAGISVRAFALAMSVPSVDGQTFAGGGLQLGTRL